MNDHGTGAAAVPKDLAVVPVWKSAPSGAPGRPVRAVRYAEVDGRDTAVAVAGTGLGVWDLASGEPLVWSEIPDAPADSNPLKLAVGTRDGDPVAVTSDKLGRIRLWDLRSGLTSGELLTDLHQRPQTLGCAGETLFAARGAGSTSSVWEVPAPDRGIDVWDIGTGQWRARLEHGGYTGSVAVTEYDGRVVAVVAATFSASPFLDPDDGVTSLTAWDAHTDERLFGPMELPEPPWSGPLAAGTFAGRLVAVLAGPGGLQVWDIVAGREATTIAYPHKINTIVWGHGAAGPLVLTGGAERGRGDRNRLGVWDPSNWRLLAETSTGAGHISNLDLAPDGHVITPWAQQVQVLRLRESGPAHGVGRP